MKRKKPATPKQPAIADDPADLRRRAEVRLRARRSGARSAAGTERQLHELEVHQFELELQNAELLKSRNELETLLLKYTELYDFAPVGYCSVSESGVILEANLTGATLLGVERSRLLTRCLPLLVSATSRPVFLAFLAGLFTEPEDQTCDALLVKQGGGTFWVGFRGASAVRLEGTQKSCRLAFGDISARKQAEETQRRIAALTDTNLELNQEIARRRVVEKALLRSEQHKTRLLKQSHQMQGRLRNVFRQVLHAQEEERKRISRELHDVIAQTLVGINVHLSALTPAVAGNSKGLKQKIVRTQRLVDESVDLVHRFARELRPTVLDDLGLIPALQVLIKEFTKRTGVRAGLKTFATIEQLSMARRTVLYRVAHEALNNVARHAQASRVELSIEKLAAGICMKIKDDGKSFHVQRVLHANRGKRLGLLGMRERLEMVGGSFGVESAPGQGTTIEAQLPLGKARRPT